jgi:hypothetical protein
VDPIEGYVLAVDDDEVIVDLADAHGAHSGQRVELWRPVTLRHPVTRKRVSDRFRIGTLELRQVRANLSLAQSHGELAHPVRIGDIVVLRVAARPKTARRPETQTPSSVDESSTEARSATPSADDAGRIDADENDDADESDAEQGADEATRVGRMFASLRGKNVAVRIVVYERYVRENPDSPFAPLLRTEARDLRRLLVLHQRDKRSHAVGVKSFAPPERALAKQPLQLGIEVRGALQAVVVHARHRGQPAYASYTMKPNGKRYYGVKLPADALRGPEIEYFVELIDERGAAHAAVGSASRPVTLEVWDQPSPEGPTRPRATVAAWTDYADYNRLRGDDTVWQTEGYFGMRFGDTGMRALRSGFGVYRGVGGSLEDLDELGHSPRNVGLTYGYLEAEIGFTPSVSLIGRGALGLRDAGITGGGQALVRIGNDLATNLLLGGEVLGGVGLRGIAQLELGIFESVPMMVRTEVTNQPAGVASNTSVVRPHEDGAAVDATSVDENDIGARAIVQVGYRFFDSLTVAARGSYQGRTIKHSGPGLGGAVSYQW